jgi:exosortase/archaeosortase family protein
MSTIARREPMDLPVAELRRVRLRFALVFAGIAVVLLALYSFPYAEHGIREDWFSSYLSLYASLAGGALRLWESNIRVTGVQIDGRTSLTIAKNCDAMDINILFTAAVLATPTTWRKRGLGLALGLTVLVAVNVLRIVSLYFVRLHWEHSFEFIHAEVWPLAFVTITVLAFLAWSRWALTIREFDAHDLA